MSGPASDTRELMWKQIEENAANGTFSSPPPRYEIRTTRHSNFDVYDLRFAGEKGRWLATFRMYKDAKAWVDSQ